jgi:hypothetical protein
MAWYLVKHRYNFVSFIRNDFFTTAKFRAVISWVLTPRSIGDRYQRFGGPCCSHLQGRSDNSWDGCRPIYYQRPSQNLATSSLKMEAAISSETLALHDVRTQESHSGHEACFT